MLDFIYFRKDLAKETSYQSLLVLLLHKIQPYFIWTKNQENDFVEKEYLIDHVHHFVMVQTFSHKACVINFKKEKYDGHIGPRHVKKFSDLEIVKPMKRK